MIPVCEKIHALTRTHTHTNEATHCNTLQNNATHGNTLEPVMERAALHCNTHVVVCCSVLHLSHTARTTEANLEPIQSLLQCVAVCRSVLQCVVECYKERKNKGKKERKRFNRTERKKGK